jgi:hypothetical protein
MAAATFPSFAVCKASFLYPTLTLGVSSLASSLLTTHHWPSLGAAAAAWRSAALLVFGWRLGADVLEIVFTERVAMADDSDVAPTPPLLAALQHKDPIVQVKYYDVQRMVRVAWLVCYFWSLDTKQCI